MNNISNDPYQSFDIDFKIIYKSIVKGIKWIIIIPIITSTIVIIYVLFIAQPVWVSQAKIFPTSKDGGGSANTSLINLASQFGISIPGQSQNQNFFSGDMFPEIVKSRSIAKALLFKKFDTDKYGSQVPLLELITDDDSEPNIESNEIITLAIDKITTNWISINRAKDSPVFTLLVYSFEPYLSTQLANAIIEETDKTLREFRNANIIEQKEFIKKRIEETKIELNEAEVALKNFRENNQQITYSPSLLLQQERIEREIEVLTNVFISLRQQFEAVKIEEVQKTTYVEVLDPPETPIFRSKPKRRQAVFIAGLIGIALGMFGAVLLNYGHLNKNNE